MNPANSLSDADTNAQIRKTHFATTPKALTAIYRDNVHMAVWQRPEPMEWQQECQQLLLNGFGGIRTVLTHARLQYIEDALPDLNEFPLLQKDICLISDMFCSLFELQSIGLRLTPLKNAMCPRFHVDWVPARLVTTYEGPGTEWLAHTDVNRKKLGARSGDMGDAESGLYRAPNDIQQLETGDIALLKGEAWDGNGGAGLVHRSPTTGAGVSRLLLTLDFQ